MCSDVYELIWFKIGMMVNITLHFDSDLKDLNLDSGHRDVRMQKTSAPIIDQSSQSVLMEFGVLLRLSV